jgi:uncharacterized protein YjbJ (UPF0337 family)
MDIPGGDEAEAWGSSAQSCSFCWSCTLPAGYVDRTRPAPNRKAFAKVVVPDLSLQWRAGYIVPKENPSMKRSTKDKAKGEFHEVKGKVKESVGRVTKNTKLEAEGRGEQMGGRIKKKIGQVEKALGI